MHNEQSGASRTPERAGSGQLLAKFSSIYLLQSSTSSNPIRQLQCIKLVDTFIQCLFRNSTCDKLHRKLKQERIRWKFITQRAISVAMQQADRKNVFTESQIYIGERSFCRYLRTILLYYCAVFEYLKRTLQDRLLS
ncbi:hypothetical protein Tsp_11009 [Trichinella spiralis]|uniref:hypothetical protein n=1 Tax=Trichinella spiralis TaxID=6334 RepID=UPI0001EFB7AB|nr:hypothetical protein Tsp_11009 [Trichinella spiralis]